jgi:hypothetical protein
MVSMSPSSVDIAAKYGLKTLRFAQGDWKRAQPEIDGYRAAFKQYHDREAPPFIIADFVGCFPTKQKVAQSVDKYFGRCFAAVANHCEFGGDHFKSLPSYSTYEQLGDAAAAAGGAEKAYKDYKDYIDANLMGTPEELWEQHLMRRELVGDYEIIANFSYGGMPYEVVYEQLKLFADKVMPKLKG